METRGHIVTGMNNQVVWGLPHVFAVFLIVAASGALNVASVASVFGKRLYKPLAPLSGLLALALLAGGLAVLVLDLGRPDRLIVAMTHYNFKSIFAWNMFLYTGFFAIVAAYLWTMLDRRWLGYSTPAGIVAFVWRLVLTTGTGSIFGFLVARAGLRLGAAGADVHRPVVRLRPGDLPAGADRGLRWQRARARRERARAPGRLLGGFVAGGAVLRRRVPPHQPATCAAPTASSASCSSAAAVYSVAVLGRAGPARQRRARWRCFSIVGSPARHARCDRRRAALIVLGGLAQMYVTIIGGAGLSAGSLSRHARIEQLLRRRAARLRAEPARGRRLRWAASRSPA